MGKWLVDRRFVSASHANFLETDDPTKKYEKSKIKNQKSPTRRPEDPNPNTCEYMQMYSYMREICDM